MYKKLILSAIIASRIISSNANILDIQLQQLNNNMVWNESDLWQRLRNGFALDHTVTKEVGYWEKRYSNPKYFNIIMQNAAPYLYFIMGEMERRGIPSELALIPIVESTYNPQAVSPSGISTGMWQFVSGTGTRFGMVQNSNLDERKDIVKSTHAAINYLIYLHEMFGSWELAIAAYNCGEGNINNALTSANSKNFYALDLRDVTHQYVPKVIALANIIQNPGKFGITLTALSNSPYFAIVHPETPLTLNQFIIMGNVAGTTFKQLNPQFVSYSYVAPQSQSLLLPINNQAVYLASLKATLPTLAQEKTAPIPVIINDTNVQLAAINLNQATIAATTYTATNPRLTETKLAQTSPIEDDDPIGEIIAATEQSRPIPTKPNNSIAATETQLDDLLATITPAKATHQPEGTLKKRYNSFIKYTVSHGDTLYSIAKKFALAVATIKTDNHLADNTLQLNQQLLIRQSRVILNS